MWEKKLIPSSLRTRGEREREKEIIALYCDSIEQIWHWVSFAARLETSEI